MPARCAIGGDNNGGTACDDIEPFTGAIDDVRVYSRALGAAEVKQLYNLGHCKCSAQQRWQQQWSRRLLDI